MQEMKPEAVQGPLQCPQGASWQRQTSCRWHRAQGRYRLPPCAYSYANAQCSATRQVRAIVGRLICMGHMSPSYGRFRSQREYAQHGYIYIYIYILLYLYTHMCVHICTCECTHTCVYISNIYTYVMYVCGSSRFAAECATAHETLL